MSAAAPMRLVDPTGKPYAAATDERIANISDLPSIWQIETRVEWLIDGLIPRGSVNLITAESGTGKTWLAYAIAGAVAHGTPFIGRTVVQTPVLYLDGENPGAIVKRDLTDLGIAETKALQTWGGWNVEPPPGPDDPRIISLAQKYKPLFIWDSLVEFADCDEQSATEVRQYMRKFRYLAHLGATVILLHHTGKSTSSKTYRGSSDIKASVDMAYLVTGKTLRGKLHRLTMEPFKSRIAPGQSFAMEFREGQGFVAVDVPAQAHKPDPSEIVHRIVSENPHSNGTRIKELAKPLGVAKGTVDEILKQPDFRWESGRGAEKLYWVGRWRGARRVIS